MLKFQNDPAHEAKPSGAASQLHKQSGKDQRQLSVVFCFCPLAFFLLSIVLSVLLQFTASDYTFIFKLFLFFFIFIFFKHK
jgi:hypothetical protein